jgi:WG containing repeat
MYRVWRNKTSILILTIFVSLSMGVIACQKQSARSSQQSVHVPGMSMPRASPPGSLNKPFQPAPSSPALSNIRYGYIDKTGKFVIAPQFLGAGDFKNGFASVRTVTEGVGKHLYDTYRNAYIDKSGKPLYKPGLYRADGVCSTDGLCPVARYEYDDREKAIRHETYQAGYIDTAGKLVIPLQHYGAVNTFYEGLALVKTPSDGNGKYPKSKYGFLDKTGNYAISPQFDQAEDFHEGLARVGITKTESDPKHPQKPRSTTYYGYVDKTGKFIVPPKFLNASPQFSGGMAWFKINNPSNEKMLWGYINREGKVAIQPRYESDLGNFRLDNIDFHEGLAFFKGGFINQKGQFVIPSKFRTATAFSEGFAEAQDKNTGYWGFINTQGEWMTLPQFTQTTSLKDGFALAFKFRPGTDIGSVYIVSKTGRITQFNKGSQEEIRGFFKEGFFVTLESNKISYINNQGKRVFSSTSPGDIHEYSEGLVAVTADVSKPQP